MIRVRVNLRPVADENLKNLEKLAAKNGYSAKLENYDLDYWITTFNKTNYGYIKITQFSSNMV